MKIEVNKNELERALIALGKLISRMLPLKDEIIGVMVVPIF